MISSFVYLALILGIFLAIGLFTKSLMTAATAEFMLLAYIGFQSGESFVIGTFALIVLIATLAVGSWGAGLVMGESGGVGQ